MKRVGSIVIFLLLVIGSFSLIPARKVGPQCDRVIDYDAGLDEPACHADGGNCCNDT